MLLSRSIWSFVDQGAIGAVGALPTLFVDVPGETLAVVGPAKKSG